MAEYMSGVVMPRSSYGRPRTPSQLFFVELGEEFVNQFHHLFRIVFFLDSSRYFAPLFVCPSVRF